MAAGRVVGQFGYNIIHSAYCRPVHTIGTEPSYSNEGRTTGIDRPILTPL